MAVDSRDDFLGELRGVGRVDSRGFFSLDPRKAREKMRQFQLADPHQCILEWIQAAVAGGATRLEVRADPQDVSLTATGWTLDAEFLEQPLAGLFISQEKSELECYRHLSIGLNAALDLNPRLIEVSTGGRMLRMWGAEKLEVAVLDPTPSAGDEPVTRIRCLQRWSWKLAQRAFLWLREGVPEEAIVLERAAFCPVELHLGDRMVTNGDWRNLHPPQGEGDLLALSRPYEGNLFRGVLDLPALPLESGVVHVVKHGITMATRTLHTRPVEFRALIHADRLLTTASHSDIVEDDRWKSVLWELDKAGQELLLNACRRFEAVEAERVVLRPHLLAALTLGAKGSADGAQARRVQEALGELPLFRTIAGEPCSFSRLKAACAGKEGRVYYHLGEPSKPLPEDELVVLLAPDEWEILRGLLGSKALVPVTSQVRLMQRAANQHRWRRAVMRAEGRLPLPYPPEVLCQADLDHAEFSGSLALRPYPRADGAETLRRPYPAAVSFFLGGRFLVARALAFGGRYFQASISHPAFKPNYTYDGVEEDDIFRDARRLLASSHAGLLCRWLASPCGSNQRQDTLERRLHLFDYLDAVSNDGIQVDTLPPEVLGYPFLATVSGRLASLSDLRRDVEEFGAVHWVDGDMRGPQGDHRQVVQADVDLAAWCGGRPVLALLKRLFPRNVVNHTACLQGERRVMERRQRPPEEWSLAGRVLLAVEVRGEGLRGEVGLALPGAVASAEGVEPAGDGGPRAAATTQRQGGRRNQRSRRQALAGVLEPVADSSLRLTLLKDGRSVETRLESFPWGPLEAVVDSADFEVNEDWDRVLDCPALAAARAALHEAGRSLATATAREILGFTGWKREVSETFLLGYVAWKRDDLPAELERVPLFPCVENWRRLTLADVREEIAETGRVRYVTKIPARPGSPVDGRPFLLLGGLSGRVLCALVGDAALLDATHELEEAIAHQAFLSRPVQDLALSASVPSWLVQLPVEGNPRGVAGLMPLDPDFDGTATLRVHHEDRELTRLVVLSAVPGEVVLASDDLKPSRDWNGLASEAAEDALRERAREALGACLEALAQSPVRPHSPEAAVLTRFVVAEARDPQQVGRLPSEGLAGRLARLPLFEDSTGEPASLLDLVAEAEGDGRLRYVPCGAQGRPAAGRVFVLEARELPLLGRMFRRLIPYAPQLADETLGAVRREQARAVDMSSFVRERALATMDLERDEIHGVLAVCPGQAGEVVLASEGLEVQRAPLFGRLPVVGVLEGSLLRPDRAWSNIELGERVRKRLYQVLDELYTGVAARVRAAVAARAASAAGPAGGAARDASAAGHAGGAARDGGAGGHAGGAVHAAGLAAGSGVGPERDGMVASGEVVGGAVSMRAWADGDFVVARDALLAYYVYRRNHLSVSPDAVVPALAVPLFPVWGGAPYTLADVVRLVSSRSTVAVAWRSPAYATREGGELAGQVVMQAEEWSVAFYRDFFGPPAVREVDSVLRGIAASLAMVTDPLRSGVRGAVQVAARGLEAVRGRIERMASEARADWAAQEADERLRRKQEWVDQQEEERQLRLTAWRKEMEEDRRRRKQAKEKERKAALTRAPQAPLPAVDAGAQGRLELMVSLGRCLEEIPGWRRTRFHEELIRHVVRVDTLPDELLVKVEQRHVNLNMSHPLAKRAVALRADRQVVAMLASAVVTAINQQLLEVTDDDELLFLDGLATWLGAGPAR